MEQALNTHWSTKDVALIVQLTQFCPENCIIGMNNQAFLCEEGILTGASNSTSLANALLTMITKPLRDLNFLLVFKRFIDDIIAHFYGNFTELQTYLSRL